MGKIPNWIKTYINIARSSWECKKKSKWITHHIDKRGVIEHNKY